MNTQLAHEELTLSPLTESELSLLNAYGVRATTSR
jgi:hypothetical protein